MSLKQPITQVRLTNVAVVRLKRRGKRFELACYKNKVLSWREGNEKDLDEVLQTTSIFTNVSKGILTKQKDLSDAFKTDDKDKVVLEILRKGELQVSERERQYQSENLFNEIAAIVTEKCVDPTTKRPFSLGIVERAMRDTIHYAVLPNKTAKVRSAFPKSRLSIFVRCISNIVYRCGIFLFLSPQVQAQMVIKQLQQHMDISRAQMRLQISIPSAKGKVVKEKLKTHVQLWEDEEWNPDFEATILIDPGSFRAIDDALREETRGQATVEVLNLAVIEDNDEQLA